MASAEDATEHAWIDWDLDGAVEATERYAELVAGLVLRAEGRENDAVPDMDWTIQALAAHVAAGAVGYGKYFDGAVEIGYDVGALTASNEKFITAYGDHSVAHMAQDIQAGYAHMAAVARTRGPLTRMGWHAGPTPVGAVLGIALNELLLHGRDLARAVKEPWEITPEAARHGFRAGLALAPVVVDRERAARVPMTYRVHVPGIVSSEWRFDADGLQVAPAGMLARVACSTRVDPRAMLLVAYGRSSALRASATGRALAWGRKPWAALTLANYLNLS
ncbi:MAG: maleylpyruvate isomerase N-terminal domain-containing protein [Sporichthyaceae bacterium]